MTKGEMQHIRHKNLRIIARIAVTLVTFILACLAFATPKSNAAVLKQINYQGKLSNTSGYLVSDGNYDMVFKLYDALANGNLLWTGTHTAANGNPIAITGGIFSVLLGSGTGNDLSSLNFDTTAYYLQVSIKNGSDVWEDLTPRKRIGAVPQAFNANNLSGDGKINITGAPAGTGISNGTVYVNPASNGGDNDNTLLGIAIAGSAKLRLNGNGKLELSSLAGAAGSLIFTDSSGGLVNDSNNIFWDNSSKLLGVGTSAPGSRVEIKGTTNDNTASALNITDSDGASKLYVQNDGKIGIGTTDPGDYVLNINGNTNISGTLTTSSTINGGSLSSTAVNGLSVSSGTISAGTWSGSTIGVDYGGTGSTDGSITGSSALTFAAGGSNQNITLTPSGTGYTLLNGNVGIGTTDPGAYKLAVNGDTDLSGALTVSGDNLTTLGGNLTISGATLSGSSLTGITLGSTGADTISLGNGGADTITIGDASATSVSILEDNWSVSSSGAANFVSIGSVAPGSGKFTTGEMTSTGNALTLSGNGANISFTGTGLSQITTATNQDLALMPGGTGKIGIGTTTPQSKLDIEGNAAIGATYSGTSSAPANGLIVEGKVGIGTTAPGAKLQVVGASGVTSAHLTGDDWDGSLLIGSVHPIRLHTDANNESQLWVNSGTASSTQLVLATDWDLDKSISLSYSPGTVEAGAGDLVIGQTATVNSHAFTHGITRFFTNGAERLRITKDGYVGIGTTSPGTRLEVTGTVALTPSATQTIDAASDVIQADAGTVKVVGASGNVTLTSAQVSSGVEGQRLTIVGTNNTDTVTLQDHDTAASSTLELGSTNRVLGDGDVLELIYVSGSWRETSFANN